MKAGDLLIRFLIVMFLLLLLSGCVRYAYQNGDCELTIWSMREIEAGSLRISKSCALTGGADGMKYNEQQMLIFQELVKKIP